MRVADGSTRVVGICVGVAAALAQASVTVHASAQDVGNLVISGKLDHQAVLFVAEADDPTSYEVSVARYIFEVPTSVPAGLVRKLDTNRVHELCRDKDGCRIALHAVNWNLGAVAHQSTWLFLSESSSELRFDEPMGLLGEDGTDSGARIEWKVRDCVFTDAESGAADNALQDSGTGFGLLNCKNGFGLGGFDCTDSDTTNVCRVVISD